MTGYSTIIHEFNKARQKQDEFPIFERFQNVYNESEKNLTVKNTFSQIKRKLLK
jgi:hypothetical protein